MAEKIKGKAYFHLPGLFEFSMLYRKFLPLFRDHRDWFYDWCGIGSIYGAPADCLWDGGRAGFGNDNIDDVTGLLEEYNISGRLTFSNSLLKEEHLGDKECNLLCERFSSMKVKNGVIVHSDLLIDYLKANYPELYLISSTTKVITDFHMLEKELDREEFSFVVPDFRFNNLWEKLAGLSKERKEKAEFLCNECCDTGCRNRRLCYENVSRKNLGEESEIMCTGLNGNKGYSFSGAFESPAFIGIESIRDRYLPMGFSHFKIEGRSLGSAMILEFLLYYMVRPEFQLKVREEIYLDSMLDLF